MKVITIIPAYNEEKTIADAVKQASLFCNQVIVVNDGSTDQTGIKAAEEGAEVFTHVINRGLGAALQTGFAASLASHGDVIVTFDADLQHDAKDLPRLIQPIIDGKADVIIGSRFLHASLDAGHLKSDVLSHRVGGIVGNILTYLLFGTWTSDSQSGLRAFSSDALTRLKLSSNKMEISSEIIGEIGRCNLRFTEIPIKPIYTEYSLSKGQSFAVGVKTALRLVVRRVVR